MQKMALNIKVQHAAVREHTQAKDKLRMRMREYGRKKSSRKPRNCGQLECKVRGGGRGKGNGSGAVAGAGERSERLRSNPKYVMKIRKQDILSLRNGH